GGIALDAGLENRIHDHVSVGVGGHGAHFHAHALLVADGNANHGAAIHRRGLELVRRFKVRVEPAICIHAGVEQQANIVAVRKNAVDEGPAQLAEFFFALGIPEEVFASLADGDIGVHTASVYAHHGLGQEAGGETHLVGHLAADQLVELDLVGRSHYFAVAVIDFKL